MEIGDAKNYPDDGAIAIFFKHTCGEENNETEIEVAAVYSQEQ